MAAITADQSTETAAPSVERVAVRRHSAQVRWMHWINLPAMAVMLWSGLRIYWADDVYAIGIGSWQWFGFFPDGFYQALDLNQHLARGIAFHLTFAWLFVLNGAAYVAYLAVSGTWRRLIPDRAELRSLGPTLLHELGIRRQAEPEPDRYNAVQKLAYATVIVMAALLVASGFAIYKPASLAWLTALLGGYRVARLIHFTVSMLFVGFVVLHVVQVARSGWGNFASMVTGFRLQPRHRGEAE